MKIKNSLIEKYIFEEIIERIDFIMIKIVIEIVINKKLDKND